jgi:hypothetical protein
VQQVLLVRLALLGSQGRRALEAPRANRAFKVCREFPVKPDLQVRRDQRVLSVLAARKAHKEFKDLLVLLDQLV